MSEDAEVDKESTAHVDDFKGALKTLLGKTFVSLEESLKKGLELFKLQGYSPLAKNADITNKTSGQRTGVFRCHGCSFRLLLHHPFGERKDYWFTLGQKGVKEHSGHAIQFMERAMARDTRHGVRAGRRERERSRWGDKRERGQGRRLQVGPRPYKLEKEKLTRRGEGVPETFDVLIRDGEALVSIDPAVCHPDLLAVLGLLLRVQKKFPDTYINVRFDKHLSYVFFAFPKMRRKGSLYGDVRLFDDKHGVSRNGYHLASCTVQANQALEIVACALFDSSNGANWKMFIEDCCKAFATSSGAPKRGWNVAISDADGCIESAIKAVDARVKIWSCWKHFQTNITLKHLAKASEWSPLHQVMEKLLTSDSVRQMESLVRLID